MNEKFTSGVAWAGRIVTGYALAVGGMVLDFAVSASVMLYFLFFLFRDGALLAERIRDAVPLNPRYKKRLFKKFTTVIRATVKGNILVAIAQGALGGLIFWFLDIPGPVLWGVVMAALSLLPAVGAALVWAPVAVYFLFNGETLQGSILAIYGVLVIGLVDNLLRPVLVGKDTKLPDYIVLLSTIGGMALLGVNGFVIGPLIAALFVASWSIFSSSSEFRDEHSTE